MADREVWEDQLRHCLTEQAAGGRAPRADLAGTAVARGRRRHRRRTVAGLAAVAGATLLATGAVLQGWHTPERSEFGPVTGMVDGPEPTSTATEEPVRLAADHGVAVQLSVGLVGDGIDGGAVLATGEGRLMDLGPIRRVASAHRLDGGWAVVTGDPGTVRLWWVTADREPVSLLGGMGAIVVDGARVAWRRGALLAAATLSGGELRDRVSTAAPAGDAHPVGFAGGAVVLARTDPGGWDTWDPARGDYRPAWTREVIRVYGGQPAEPAPVGLVPAGGGDGGSCLARLEVGESLTPAQEVSCLAAELSVDGPAAVSPKGRWLLTSIEGPDTGPGAGESASAPAGRATVLVDLTAAFASGPAPVTEVEQARGLTARPVWLEPDRALLTTAGTLVQLWPERLVAGDRDAVEVVTLSGAAPLPVQPG